MTTITEFITALGRYGFLQSALLAAIMVGIMSGIIGRSSSYAGCR